MRVPGRLVRGHGHPVLVHEPDVDAAHQGPGDDGAGVRHPDRHGVEEHRGLHLQADRVGEPRDLGDLLVRVLRDPPQPVRAVPDRVHAGHDGEKHLGGADVGRRLLAADVLLARLQRQAECGATGGVLAHADQPAGEQPLEPVADGHVAGVGAAVAHRHTEALHGPDGHVGAPLPRRLQQREGQRVGGDRDPAARLDDRGGDGAQVTDLARRAGVLQQGTEDRSARQRGGDQAGPAGHGLALGVADRQVAGPEVQVDELDAQRLGPGLQDGPGLRQHVGVDEEHRVLRRLAGTAQQGHGLRRRGRLVEQAGVGDVEPGEVGDQGLEGEQGLEPPLADLGLVGRVGGVPGRVLQHVAADHGRGDRPVVAESDHRLDDRVAGRDPAQRRDGVLLGQGRREVQRHPHPDRRRHRGLDQRCEALVPGGARVGVHVRDVTQVPVDEGGDGACLHAAPRGVRRALGQARLIGPRQSGLSPPACLCPAVLGA